MDAWKHIRTSGAWTRPVLTSALAVFLLMTLLVSWISVSGTSALACAAWCLAVAAGAAIAPLIDQRFENGKIPTALAAGTAVVLTATASIGFETCLKTGIALALPQPVVWLTASLPTFVASVVSFVLFRVPDESAIRRRVGGIITGSGLFIVHTWLPYPFAIAATILAITAIAGLISSEGQGSHHTESGPSGKRRPKLLQLLLSAAAGMGLVGTAMVLNRVFTVSPVAIAMAVLLTAIAMLVAMAPVLQISRRPWRAWAGSLLMLACLPLLYPSAIGGNLQVLATATTGVGVILFHAIQLVVCWTPLLGSGISGSRAIGPDDDNGFHASAAATGAAAAWILSAAAVSPTWIVFFSIVTIVVVPASTLWSVPAVSRRFRILRLAGSTVALAAVATPVACPPDLASPSNLTFDVRSIIALQRGVQPEMIPETDAARLINVRETAAGTMTTWKAQSNLLELRVNGHQIGQVSTNTFTTPQPPAQVLTCVLPLVLHPQAGSVLIMDDVCGVARSVCTQFPVHRLELVDAPNRVPVRAADIAPNEDRIRSHKLSPEIAVRSRLIEPVDVAISMLADPSRPTSLSRLSASWFQAVSTRLAADGVFCQRVRYRKIGSDSLVQILGNVSSAFQQIAMVQLVPGEVAIVATNSGIPLLDKGVLARMERQHVRRQLSRCGWDWCQLAALSVIDSTDPIGLWEHYDIAAPTQIPSGVLTLAPGFETAKQVNQWMSIGQLLAPHERRIAEAVPTGPQHGEFRRRISAYAQQVEVLTAFPDEPWIYRKSLRSEMQRNQRPPVETIENGKLQRHTHPLDEHRKNYFRTLGMLLKKLPEGKLETQDLNRLNEFSVDYEPLISDFAHHELVRIHELAGNPLPVDEFQHRLHTVNFTQPGDYSVRNVIAALEQLTRQPEVVNSDAERYDQLNTLIQELIVRWESRTHFEPRSAVRMQRDVELSVQTVQTALLQMESLSESVGIARDQFLTRRRFVSEALIGPLRDYKDQVLAHRAKTEPLLVSEEDLSGDFDDTQLPMLLDQPATN